MVQRDCLAPPRVQEPKLTSLQRHNNPCSEPCHFWPEGLVRPHCGCRIIFLIALCRGEEKTCRNQKHILFILRKNKKQTDTTRKQKRREHEMVAAERDTAVPLINCWQPWKSSWKSVCATPKLFCHFPSCCVVQLINPGQTPFPSTQSLTQAASCCS